ncbi:MAG: iron chaperone [Anaerolineales bacterium]
MNKTKSKEIQALEVVEEINSILAPAPMEHRATLQKIRETIRAAVPEAVEAISYGLPAFKYKGKPLAGYGSYKDHCMYFPMSGNVTAKLKKELQGYKTSKGGIHFQPDKPLPATLVRKLVRARIEEIEK